LGVFAFSPWISPGFLLLGEQANLTDNLHRA